MARRNNPNTKSSLFLTIILQIIILVLRFLIGIGDAIRGIIRTIFSLPRTTYNLIQRIFKVSKKNTAHLYSQIKRYTKFSTVQSKKKRGRPGKSLNSVDITTSFFLPFTKVIKTVKNVSSQAANYVQKITIKTRKAPSLFKWRIPKLSPFPISFPKISWPPFGLFKTPKIPLLRVPRITLPKANIPNLPPPSVLDRVKFFIAGIAVTIVFFFAPYMTHQWLRALPNPELLSRRDLQVTTKIFDRNGALLYEIYADENRTPLPLEDIPEDVKEATIAIEDQDFYRHQGISIRGILRASRETLLNRQVQGGSTITQQLIKSALLSPEVKLTRKIKEVILAFWAERLYTKNQILEMYLNQVPYGGTAWGAEAASQTYFGKSVRTLNLAEAALLAGLPQAPTEYSPFGSHPEKAYERQKEVLRRMVEDRYITKEEEQAALVTPITFAQPRTALHAPHFVMYVKNLLEQQYGPRIVEQGGLRIKTSLDLSIQEKAEDIVSNQINSLSYLRVGNGAAMVTDPNTGEILAMVGSKNYFDIASEGNVNVATSLRQPGSSIKVVSYAAALENGFTAASIIDDSPIVYRTPGSPPYAPVNYDGKFHGPTSFRYALANSYNIPAVKILAKIGVQTMIDKARLMGISSWQDEERYGLSLALGGGDVTMLDMTKVFGTLANEGKRVDLMPILEVTDYTGKVLEKHKPKSGVQAIKPETAWIMSNILSDNTARIAAFGPNSSLVIPNKTVSVKTGTTDSKRDNWTIGYTPSYVVATWVGNNDNTPMNPALTSGVTGAAPIWHDIMNELLKDKPNEIPPKPDTVLSLPCYFGRPEYFIAGSEPAGGRCGPIPVATPSGTLVPTP
jgi:1A family penicillin-binding protein